MQKIIIYTTLLLFIVIQFPSNAQVTGTVKDLTGKPVSGVEIKFINENDRNIVYKVVADQNGNFIVEVPGYSIHTEKDFDLFPNYPNPFCSGTVIPFYLKKDHDINLSVYNLYGQKIKTIASGRYEPGLYHFIWDGTDDNNQRQHQGAYIYNIICGSYDKSGKMILLDNCTNEINIADIILNSPYLDKEIKYTVLVSGDEIEQEVFTGVELDDNKMDVVVTRKYPVPFATVGKYIGIWNGDGYTPMFLKGVNLGVAVPGTQPGEMAATREQYQRWLKRIGELGFNCLRVYTLHYPRFYEELAAYNANNKENPLYVFHGVWLDEDMSSPDIYDMTEHFNEAIEEIIDCVHGNNEIDQRYGRAFGRYETDISRWIMGYIMGREVFPEEVLYTDSVHIDINSYNGDILKLPSGTATEVWITQRVEYLIKYERTNYNVERPISFSSWPTLDPLTHPTESPDFTDEDVAAFDLANLDLTNAPGGYFASFHAYPYYPNFVSEDPGYREYYDDYGPNSYLGYLSDLVKHYGDMPVVIGEFGTPSSWGNAHFSFTGMNHGGLTETQQGENDARLLENIYDAGCGGGMLFSWIDEWFKITWIADPIGTPANRRHLWHNLTSPEQNFGLIAFEENEPEFKRIDIANTGSEIKKVEASSDNKYFHLKLSLENEITENDTIWIAIDTYRSDLGESILPNSEKVENRAEFALMIAPPDSAKLMVTQAYDLFAIWHRVAKPEQLFRSVATDGSDWKIVRWKNDRYDDAVQYIGKLGVCSADEEPTNLDAIFLSDNEIKIRLPWTLIQFVDPSRVEVMHDDRSTPERETMTSDGIAVTVFYRGTKVETSRYTFSSWEQGPEVYEREKPSMEIFSKRLKQMPGLLPDDFVGK